MSKRGTIKPEVAFKELSAAKKAAKKSKKEKAMETQSAEAVIIQEPVTIVDVTPAVVPEPVVEAPVVEAAPVEKKPKVNKRPYIEDVKGWIEAGSHSRKEIIDTVLAKFPQVSKGGITTFVTDLKNPRYCHFAPREVVEKDGKLIFADVVVARAQEAGTIQPATEPEPEATDQAE